MTRPSPTIALPDPCPKPNPVLRVPVILFALALLSVFLPPTVDAGRPDRSRKERDTPGYPEEYIQWRESFYRDENGKVDPVRMQNARAAAKKVPLNPRLLPAVQKLGGQPDTLISPADWTWRGPGNIGGRVRALLIHPTETNRIWLGSVSGGIWYSSDRGTSWAPVNDFLANLAVCSLIMDPTNPNVIYAGTGEGFFNFDGIRGAGIFKSIDGGVTWNQLASTNNDDFLYVNRLAIAPDGVTLLAATTTGIWRSPDAGVNWSKVQTTTDRMTQVAFDPNNSNNAIATGYSANAYYSTNGGRNWTAATGLGTFSGTRAGRSEFAYAKSAPGIVYIAFHPGSSSQLYKSTDGGQTYVRITISGSTQWMSSQGWYNNTIWVDPTNANTLIVGGLDLYRSTNGGANLTRISDWLQAPASAHADHHGIFADPGYDGVTNKRVYFTNDGGAYRAENALTVTTSSGWQELNNNLGITQFYGAAGNPETLTMIGGAQDNGTLRYRPIAGTEGLSKMNGGDGGYCAADQTDPNYFYGEYVYATIARSTDGGATSSDIWNGIADANSSSGAEFIAPFILDPNNQARMLVGGKRLWRSSNVKAPTPVWASIKASLGTARSDNITAVAVTPGNSDIVWVGHGNGNVYVTNNGTAATPTWTRVDESNPATPLPNRRIGRIVIDPANANRVYVGFGGYADPLNFGAANLWRTDDAGLNWSDSSGNLPLVPIYGMAIRPDDSNVLYAATDVGVFGSEDAGATWSATNIGPANVSTTDVFFMGRYLVACTHGRGMFTVPVLPGPPDEAAPTLTITPDNTVTNALPIIFRFTFSEPVEGFAQSDVVVNGGTGTTFASLGSSLYTLSVIPTESNGIVSISVPGGACADLASNSLAGPAAASVTYNSASPFLYATNFDGLSAPPAWTIQGGEWAWGTPVKFGGPSGDHTGAGKLFATRLSVDYGDNAYAILTSQPCTIPAGTTNPYKLRFWMWLAAENNFDGGHLQISVDGGPFTLLPGSGLTVPYNHTALDGLIQQPGYTGNTTFNSWRRVRSDLAPYAGKTVLFRFVFGSDVNTDGPGWFIDDFAIEQDPIVSLAVPLPIAHENGTNGQFTLSLQPSAPENRTLNYTIGGTAVPGASYAPLSGVANVAAGASSVSLSIAAAVDGSNAPRIETVTLMLNSGLDYTIGTPSNALVVILGSGLYDQWREAHFTAAEIANAAISAPTANPSGDGISNLLKHALGLDPDTSSTTQLPHQEFVELEGSTYQQLRVVSPSNTAVSFAGEVSPDLAQWSSAPADVLATVEPDLPATGQTTRIFRDLTPTSSGTRFIRLKVTLN